MISVLTIVRMPAHTRLAQFISDLRVNIIDNELVAFFQQVSRHMVSLEMRFFQLKTFRAKRRPNLLSYPYFRVL
jgi:hypothetical protein